MFGPTFVMFAAIVSVTAALAYRWRLAHQLRIKELQLKQLELRRRATPEVRRKDPELPAFVDPEDQASMDAWKETQTELDEAW